MIEKKLEPAGYRIQLRQHIWLTMHNWEGEGWVGDLHLKPPHGGTITLWGSWALWRDQEGALPPKDATPEKIIEAAEGYLDEIFAPLSKVP